MHAYLITVHNNWYVVEKLIRMIDDERNDIYMHVDKKVKNFDYRYFKNLANKSRIFYVKRVNVQWGAYSLIQAELNLFKAASRKKYSYYHILSGADLPIKSQDYIHDFFTKNRGMQFITCVTSTTLNNQKILDRFNYYYMFRGKLRIGFLKLQKKMNFTRKRENMVYNYGSQWVSITDDFVKLILRKEKWIKKTFKFTQCCDEVYKQSIIMNSEFSENIYPRPTSLRTKSFNMRYIKWTDGSSHPYIFREKDFEELMISDCLFARKFDENIDRKIVDLIYSKIVCDGMKG